MTIRRILPLAAVLAAAGIVVAQPAAKKDAPPKEPPKPASGSLEDTLEKALRNSADIKAAEAKVRDAEAELNRVRHQVLTKATALHADLNLAKRMLVLAEDQFARLRATPAAALQGDLIAAQTAIEKHRGEVEKLEAELKSLRGEFAIKSLTFSPDGAVLQSLTHEGVLRLWNAKDGTLLREVRDTGVVWDFSGSAAKTSPVPTPMFDRIKKLLEQEVQWKVENADVSHALKSLLQAAKTDIPLRDLFRPEVEGRGPNITLDGKLSVGAWIQAIEDSDPVLRVVARDYGLLLTTADRVPPGALRVQDVWKGNYVQLKKDDLKGAEKK